MSDLLDRWNCNVSEIDKGTGDCSLIDDDVILFIDRLLSSLKKENKSLKAKTWTTYDEKMAISNLGRFKPELGNKRDFILGYLEGCKKRHDWGNINKDEVIEFATRRLIN